eukprot:gb/GECG01015613.1/.p1 GENE.gb/GECG01015613.1/~~gb/GECG01015613.1/.p1  ORF type:complete len:667 (+),score=75.91 gb/GECG01015613.1/:1-2001(+)
MKVLFCGDIQGSFDAFFSKLQALNQSAHGPFDACFCTGSFFLPPQEDGEAPIDAPERGEQALEALRQWEGKVPMDVYFVLGADRANQSILNALDAAAQNGSNSGECINIISRVHFLGTAGIKYIKGFRVGFLSGLQHPDPSGYREANDDGTTSNLVPKQGYLTRTEVDHVLKQATESTLEVATDILLTPEWPYNFHLHVAAPLWPNFEEKFTNESAAVTSAADVAATLRPRYHFAARCGVFYQRPPYRNLPTGGKTMQIAGDNSHDGSHVTRFIGLGKVADSPPKLKKYIHALNLDPVEHTSPETLTQKPSGTTENPYLEAPKNNASGSTGKRLRTDMSQDKVKALQEEGAKEAEDHKQVFWNIRGKKKSEKRQGDDDEERQKKRKKIAEQQQRFFRQACFFCMSSPSFESHMVISIAESSFLTLPKGPVDENHVLVVPLDHCSRLAEAPDSLHLELAQYKLALRQYFGAKGLCMISFERVVKTRHPAHTHLQVFGMKPSQVLAAPNEFMEHGERVKAEFAFLEDDDKFKNYFRDAAQYFYVECFTDVYSSREIDDLKSRDPTDASHKLVGDCVRLGYKIPEGQRFPLQFGRDVVCQIMGCPDRKFWYVFALQSRGKTSLYCVSLFPLRTYRKDCASDQGTETRQTETFRNGFAPYDFALDESDED